MADQLMSRCGEYCEGCGHRESDGCSGCRATEGKPFWGEYLHHLQMKLVI